MSQLAHADIFFFITSVATIIIAILFIVLFVFVIKTIKDIREIAAIVRRQAELVSGDIDSVREHVRKGLTIKHFLDYLKFVPALVRKFTSAGKKKEKSRGQAK